MLLKYIREFKLLKTHDVKKERRDIMAEIRIRVNVMLKERIKMFAKERGISINEMCIELLESGILNILEMELGNEKIKSEQIDR